VLSLPLHSNAWTRLQANLQSNGCHGKLHHTFILSLDFDDQYHHLLPQKALFGKKTLPWQKFIRSPLRSYNLQQAKLTLLSGLSFDNYQIKLAVRIATYVSDMFTTLIIP